MRTDVDRVDTKEKTPTDVNIVLTYVPQACDLNLSSLSQLRCPLCPHASIHYCYIVLGRTNEDRQGKILWTPVDRVDNKEKILSPFCPHVLSVSHILTPQKKKKQLRE